MKWSIPLELLFALVFLEVAVIRRSFANWIRKVVKRLNWRIEGQSCRKSVLKIGISKVTKCNKYFRLLLPFVTKSLESLDMLGLGLPKLKPRWGRSSSWSRSWVTNTLVCKNPSIYNILKRIFQWFGNSELLEIIRFRTKVFSCFSKSGNFISFAIYNWSKHQNESGYATCLPLWDDDGGVILFSQNSNFLCYIM